MSEPFPRSAVTRRCFLGSCAALTVAHPVLASPLLALNTADVKTMLAFVGTYTGAPGAGSNGEGIYAFDMNPVSGELSHRRLVAKTPSPSWLCVHPSGKYLYAANEVSDFRDGNGSVSAYRIDRSTGDLTALNVVGSEGADPCYLTLDAAGKYAFVANYAGGSIAVLPILGDGSLGAATDIRSDVSHLGATQAPSAPPGSYAISGHEAPHAHMIAPDPHHRFVLATDLAQDRIYTYGFDPTTGKLTPTADAPFTSLPSGDGPRHFAFHPNGRWLYSIQEEASTIVFFHFDPDTGSLRSQQTVSALPPGFTGTSFASEILLSPDGRFLYAANRLSNTIASFSIAVDGRLNLVNHTPTIGDYPAQLRLDPSANFLYACNRRSDNITCFRIDRQTGILSFTGHYTAVGSPGSITFLD